MRNIGRIEDASAARTFSDALVARGIGNDLREDGGAFAVWVHDDARVPEAKEALDQLRRDGAEAFRDQAASGQRARKERARKDSLYRERLALARASMHGVGARPYVTWVVGFAAVVVAGVSGLGSNWHVVDPLLFTTRAPAAGFPEIASGQLWRLFTPALVHFGLMHIAFNVLSFGTFAAQVEARKGHRFVLLLVLTSAVLSIGAEYAWLWALHPLRPAAVGGLSGVVYAVAGYLLVKGKLDPLESLDLPPQTTTWIVGWLVLGFTGVLGPIANLAHLGGLVWGVIWAGLDMLWFRWRKGRL